MKKLRIFLIAFTLIGVVLTVLKLFSPDTSNILVSAGPSMSIAGAIGCIIYWSAVARKSRK